MHQQPSPEGRSDTTRRNFLQNSAAAAGVGLTLQAGISRTAHAAGSDILRVGLIGCGGRGRGSAVQALKADPQTKLVALADVFESQVANSLQLFKRSPVGDRVDVSPEQQFVGFDAYQKLLASDVDVVLLATPPHFRPVQLKACVEANKHVFAEKPVAVDAPGVRSVLASCQEAKRRNLAMVSGLCWRYHNGAGATMQRVHDGQIGDIVAIQTNYNASRPGKPWPMPRDTGWTDLEWQLHNWYWFTWLSGDHIVEQAIHSIDKAAWAMHDEPPVSAVGLGGLQTRINTKADPGQIFDHHAVVYEYPGGVRHFHYCRQQPGCANEVSTLVMGSKGTSHIEKHTVQESSGKQIWKFAEKRNTMHQAEQDELFASIRQGQPLNNGEYMCRSTMLAIMGRMTTYTGQKISWDQALNSQQDFSLKHYDMSIAPPPATIATPGQTKFV